MLAVDSDEQLVSEAMPRVAQAAQADATDEAALADMCAGNFDAAVVAIDTNARDSILITALCKEAGVLLGKSRDIDAVG